MKLSQLTKPCYGIAMSLCLLASLTTSSLAIASNDCNDEKMSTEASHLIASYLVAITEKNKKPVISKMVLARKGNQAAYSKNGITEVWDLLKNNRVKLTKYFDQYNKGIEYQANEIKTGSGKLNWSSKYQLVPDYLISSMQVDKTELRQCKTYQQLSKQRVTKIGNDKLNISWLVDFLLAEKIDYRSDQRQVTWKLVNIEHERKKVKEHFERLESYQLTDYADIGDNESDPFLRKMINLGFVDHSESVFFANKKGIQAPSQHSHQH